MELHLHLSATFRSLDQKWGPAIDLSSSEVSLSCMPAVIDRPTTTFSSEEFLKKRQRPKPYSRFDVRRRKENLKRNDSIADISLSRIPSVTEATIDLGLDGDRAVKRSNLLERCGSKASLDSDLDEKYCEEKPVNRIFKNLKTSAKYFFDKCRKIG